MDNERGDPALDLMVQRWPAISLSEAATVLAQLEHPLKVTHIISVSGRPMAAGCLVATDHGDMYIKRYATAVRESGTVLPYHRFVAHVADKGIPTPVFRRFADMTTVGRPEQTILHWNDSIYEVSERAIGEDRYSKAYIWDPPRHATEAESLGAFLGRLDIASRGFNEPRPSPCGYQARFSIFEHEDVVEAARQWLSQRPLIAQWLHDTGRDYPRDIARFGHLAEQLAPRYRTVERIWTHGDTHLSNFMWKGDAPSAIFDFGMADRNTAVFELAMALERHTIQWLDVMKGHPDSYRTDLIEAIIHGYHSVRPLTDDEREVLPDVVAASQIEGGSTLIDYWLRSEGRAEDIAWGYDVGFVAHGDWYLSTSGTRYLDAIRNVLDRL